MITGLSDGIYALKSTVDPLDRLLESDENNNATVLYFSIHENRLEVLGIDFSNPASLLDARRR
jgi:subtilase family serine protease